MKTFTTTDGSTWTVELNIATARKLRAEMRNDPNLKAVDFLDYAALLTSLNDVFFAADLLWLICKEQAEARGIDAETFGTLLRGELLFEAVGAFTEEYLDFFPDPTVAKKMRALVGTVRDAQTALCETICGKTETLLREALEDAETAFGTPSSTRSESAAETTPESAD